MPRKEYYQQHREKCIASTKAYRNARKEEVALKSKIYREANKDIIALKRKEEHKNNPEPARKRAAEWYLLNRDKVLNKTPEQKAAQAEVNKIWRENNIEHCRSRQKKYRLGHIEYYRAIDRRRSKERKILKTQRIPAWSNLDHIKEIYNNCPLGQHVDHIVPLNGKNVCGLHLEYNLQYLTPEENLRKNNIYPHPEFHGHEFQQ